MGAAGVEPAIDTVPHGHALVNAARLERATIGLKTRCSTFELRAVKDAPWSANGGAGRMAYKNEMEASGVDPVRCAMHP